MRYNKEKGQWPFYYILALSYKSRHFTGTQSIIGPTLIDFYCETIIIHVARFLTCSFFMVNETLLDMAHGHGMVCVSHTAATLSVWLCRITIYLLLA